MTRREKAKLFGRLTETEQREIVHKAHQAADQGQAEVGIVMFGLHTALIVNDRQRKLLGAEWQLVRTVKPRPVQNSDIRSVMQADSRRRSAPWEGRGHHD